MTGFETQTSCVWRYHSTTEALPLPKNMLKCKVVVKAFLLLPERSRVPNGNVIRYFYSDYACENFK